MYLCTYLLHLFIYLPCSALSYSVLLCSALLYSMLFFSILFYLSMLVLFIYLFMIIYSFIFLSLSLYVYIYIYIYIHDCCLQLSFLFYHLSRWGKRRAARPPAPGREPCGTSAGGFLPRSASPIQNNHIT